MESSEVHEELYNKDTINYFGSYRNKDYRTYLFTTGDSVEEDIFGMSVICPCAVAFICHFN